MVMSLERLLLHLVMLKSFLSTLRQLVPEANLNHLRTWMQVLPPTHMGLPHRSETTPLILLRSC